MIIQDFKNIIRISICRLKILSKFYMTSQDVALYYNVKIFLKNLLTNKRIYDVLKTLIMVFNDFLEYFILIKFNPNHIACFHNIL